MTTNSESTASKQDTTALELVPLEQEAGVLAALLLKQGIITEKQLTYALRIRKKITPRRPCWTHSSSSTTLNASRSRRPCAAPI